MIKLEDFAVLITVIIITLTVYIKWCYAHWSRNGLEYVKPTFPFGNFWETVKLKMTMAEEIKRHFFHMKSRGAKHMGLFFFHVPVYVPIDLDIIKHILKVDFANFEDRATYHNAKSDPLSEHLITLEGEKWKQMRSRVSATFTPSKMKLMFPHLIQKSEKMIELLESHLPEEAVDVTDIFSRLAINIIVSCSFGIDPDNMHGPETEFDIQGKNFFHHSQWRKYLMFISVLYPNAMRRLGTRFTPKGTESFFMGVMRDAIKYREENNVTRNDFLQLLISLKNDDTINSSKYKVTEEVIAGISFGLFTAGFETSSVTLSFCLYELAQHDAIQEKMREEIYRVLSKHNGEFTYEAMTEMNYMDSVINETMRKYPPVPVLTRRCKGDSKIPKTNLTLKKGDIILIPVGCVQHDPEYYPNPERFDPDRFTDENKRTRQPYTFMPFGEGPRFCVGYRFGIMEVKVGLTILFKDYKFKLNSKTSIPLVLDPKAMLNAPPASGIWVNVEKITEK